MLRFPEHGVGYPAHGIGCCLSIQRYIFRLSTVRITWALMSAWAMPRPHRALNPAKATCSEQPAPRDARSTFEFSVKLPDVAGKVRHTPRRCVRNSSAQAFQHLGQLTPEVMYSCHCDHECQSAEGRVICGVAYQALCALAGLPAKLLRWHAAWVMCCRRR